MSPRVKNTPRSRCLVPLPMARIFPALLCCFVVVACASARAADVPSGRVLVEICESDIPRNGSWPESTARATEHFLEDAFGLFELPQKYISTGVRADRAFQIGRAHV